MAERGMFPAHVGSAPADVIVAVWSEDYVCDSIKLAQELRHGGVRTDLYPEADKLGKQFKYAAGRGVPFVAIIGTDERAAGEVSIKDLRSGEQKRVARLQVVAEIKGSLK